jgi:uncharacterized cupin superfamily protein
VVPEAPLEQGQAGLVPAGEGWFVVNARDAEWLAVEGWGAWTSFEGPNVRFPDLGIGLYVLGPGEPMAMYHAEELQEGFVVLAGEGLLVIEGQERPLRTWDFVHCPPWAAHVIIGAGTGPCVVLAVGARRKGRGLRYPVDEVALRHGAGVKEETGDPAVAYAELPEPQVVSCPTELPSA